MFREMFLSTPPVRRLFSIAWFFFIRPRAQHIRKAVGGLISGDMTNDISDEKMPVPYKNIKCTMSIFADR